MRRLEGVHLLDELGHASPALPPRRRRPRRRRPRRRPRRPPLTTPSPTDPRRGGEKLAVEADPTGQLAYTETKLTAKAGKTTIDFKNPSPTPHNVVIRQGEGEPLAETEIVSSKEVTTSVDLKAGTYEYYCSVPGHEQAGMKGTLTVK